MLPSGKLPTGQISELFTNDWYISISAGKIGKNFSKEIGYT